MNATKKCNWCLLEKPETEFYLTKRGILGNCKPCSREYNKKSKLKAIETGKKVLKNKKINSQELLDKYYSGVSVKQLSSFYGIASNTIQSRLKRLDPDYRYKNPEEIQRVLLLKEGKKKCYTCEEVKTIDSFYPDKRMKDGRMFECDKCNTKKVSELYYENHEYSKERDKIWRLKNPEKVKKQRKDALPKARKRAKERYDSDPIYKEARIIDSRKYRQNPENKEKIRATQNKLSKKYKKNPAYRILQNLRRKMLLVLDGQRKADFSLNLIGCDRDKLKLHLESQFKEGMSWDNYGVYRIGGPMTWHIDHIIPCDYYDFYKEIDQRRAFHYTNLQPLWAIDNLSKGSKFMEEPPLALDWTDWKPQSCGYFLRESYMCFVYSFNIAEQNNL